MSLPKRFEQPDVTTDFPVVGKLTVTKGNDQHGGYAPLSTFTVLLKHQNASGLTITIAHPKLQWLITATTLPEAFEQMEMTAGSVIPGLNGSYLCQVHPVHEAPKTPRKSFNLGNPMIADLLAYQADANRDARKGDQLLMFHPSELYQGEAVRISPNKGVTS